MIFADKAYDEMVDLFARGCDPQAILEFRPSARTLRRARYLLQRSKQEQLTSEEANELERLGQIEHLMQLV